MIVCPNCNHQNPDGAVQCEACYTPLPVLSSCPSCGAAVQSDASFCGQCGFDLRTTIPPAAGPSNVALDPELTSPGTFEFPAAPHETAAAVRIPDLIPPDPLVIAEPLTSTPGPGPEAAAEPPRVPPAVAGIPDPIAAPMPAAVPISTNVEGVSSTTQLQINAGRLLHVQTNMVVELPSQLNIIHIGKPNDRIPPTIDVSGFPNSEIVSRVHADIRVEGDIYYLEDVGSSNGTYVNNMPLPPGNRHRLRSGDRVALGKGDKVTFIFQSN